MNSRPYYMTPGLSLTGRVDLAGAKLARTDVRDWLARAAVWFETVGDAVLGAELGRDADGRCVLSVAFHPVVEDVEVRLSTSGGVRVSARTWPAGPGYHAYLCGVLASFADDFGVEWEHIDDPTGFFRGGDETKLRTHFLAHLWQSAGDLAAAPDPVALGLPADHGFTHPGPVLTPLGPRSRGWLSRTATDPSNGRDFFAWWAADLDAAFYRDRAVALLWCEFPWRPPLTDDEGELTDEIAADLEMAHSLDPAGELPWAEWAELLAVIEAGHADFTVQGIESELKVEILTRAADGRAAGLVPAEPVGYRRRPVRVAVGGWSVEVPGSFAEGWSDDGRTWCGWDARRRVTLTLSPGPRHPVTEDVLDESGRPVWRLTAGTDAVAVRVEVADAADRGWAAGVWHSLRHEPAAANLSVG